MIIFDLDGVLADNEHRRHLLNPDSYRHLYEYSNYRIIDGQTIIDLEGKLSWRCKKTGEPFKTGSSEFYHACDKDNPIEATKTVLYDLMASDACHHIEIWSGRCESVRKKTEDWLSYHFQSLFHGTIDEYKYLKNLKMRPIGDTRPDHELKEQWLDELLGNSEKMDFVFDSDPKSIKMWRRRGIFVFDCNQEN